jgi:metal-sulfur cluster biosynthetic enzyme
MSTQPQPATLAEADILAALRDCYEPEIALNIVDLGLIESISLAPDPAAPGSGIPGVPPRHRVSIALILINSNSSAESDGAPLIAQIQNRLAAFETISRTEVHVLSHPAWTPDRISPEGRKLFAAHLNSRKGAHDLIQIKIQP